MKLDYLWVQEFKNLSNFSVDFDENPAELFTVILGRNGFGKSNLLEVLVIVFRDLFRGSPTDFEYELRYTLRRGEISVTVKNHITTNSAAPKFSFTATRSDGTAEIIRRDDLKEVDGRQWLPRHLFAYYSGPSDRLEEHSARSKDSFIEIS